MKNLSELFRRSSVKIVAFLAIGIAITALVIASPKFVSFSKTVNNTAMPIQPQITNFSQFLVVSGTNVTEQGIALTLKNISPKAVTALHVTTGTMGVLIDFAASERVIKPNQEFTHVVPLLPNSKENSISLDAVVFEDISDEGKPEVIQRIKDKRLAHESLKSHASLRIDKALTSKKVDSAELDKIIAEMDVLQIPSSNSSKEFEIGLATAKQDVQHDLSELKSKIKDSKVKPEEELLKVKGNYDAFLQKVKAK